tara:strand:- start:88 stop:1518 length:1431 start_codon:yes stop_codon:yes gene_type:complete
MTLFLDKAHKNTHGLVLRSSGIFYYKKNPNFKTTLTFLNYWKIKRELKVKLICSTRALDGSLILREEIKFTNSDVINYTPSISESNFEGSVEIEIFGLEDLVIPYAAIMVIYESKFGISMTHTYGRTYSLHEIEDGNILPIGEETCCHSLIPKKRGNSYLIFHNGGYVTPEQTVNLSLLNYAGKRITASFQLETLNPYQTVKIDPRNYFENYDVFLDEKPGNISISFTLNQSAFPRLLSVNESSDQNDFQVNHSNFNLSKIVGPKLDDEYGYNNPPSLPNVETELIIYPDCEDGKFEAIYDNQTVQFNKDSLTNIKIIPNKNDCIKFRKINDKLPLRIHTGIRLSKSNDLLPSETCRGIWHSKAQPKRFFWLPVAGNKKIHSRITVRPYKNSENNDGADINLILKLYSEKNSQILDTKVKSSILNNGAELITLFPECESFLGNSFGWLTIFSEYPFFDVTGTMENEHDSISYEHAF